MNKAILLVFMALQFLGKVNAQQNDIAGIFRALKGKVNQTFPVSDSLYPMSVKSLTNIRKFLPISRKDAREIRAASKTPSGIKLNNGFLAGARLIAASPAYRDYPVPDSSSLSFIETNKPFYIISAPLFFAGRRKAIIDIDLIGRGGYTYLLVKENVGWAIQSEIVRWVV